MLRGPFYEKSQEPVKMLERLGEYIGLSEEKRRERVSVFNDVDVYTIFSWASYSSPGFPCQYIQRVGGIWDRSADVPDRRSP